MKYLEMSQKEKEIWAFPEKKVKRIARNVEEVFQKQDISLLSKEAYRFIVLKMSFIAHYDRGGFCGVYGDLNLFARALLTSEYSDDEEHNLRGADRQERDRDFNEWYGEEYCKNSAKTMRLICASAKRFLYPLWEGIEKGEGK